MLGRLADVARNFAEGDVIDALVLAVIAAGLGLAAHAALDLQERLPRLAWGFSLAFFALAFRLAEGLFAGFLLVPTFTLALLGALGYGVAWWHALQWARLPAFEADRRARGLQAGWAIVAVSALGAIAFGLGSADALVWMSLASSMVGAALAAWSSPRLAAATGG